MIYVDWILLNVEVDIICSFRCWNSRRYFAVFDLLNIMVLVIKMLDYGILFKYCWFFYL